MEIKVYMNKNQEEVANKELTQVGSYEGEVREGIELYDELVVRIESDVNPLSVMNYAWIGTPYNRYYIVTKCECICDGIYDLSLQSDVLMSFKDYFADWEGIVKRQENKYNLMLNDGSFRLYQNPIVIQKSFPNGFSGGEYVIICAGKGIKVE